MNYTDGQISKKIGERIKAAREKKGYSQEEFAFKAGIGRSYISEIESGKKFPSLSVLNTILTTLKISFKDFFDF